MGREISFIFMHIYTYIYVSYTLKTPKILNSEYFWELQHCKQSVVYQLQVRGSGTGVKVCLHILKDGEPETVAS